MPYLILLLLLGITQAGWGEDSASTEPPTIQKTSERLHFNVPPDWPIEKRGGIMAPIPIEEYLARKFKALDARLRVLEQQFNGFDVRLRVVEEQAKQQRQGLRSSEASSDGQPQETAP